MSESQNHSVGRPVPARESSLSIAGFRRGLHRYWHYLFVVSILTMALSVLALLNASFRFNELSLYGVGQGGLSSSVLTAGYLGMFFSMAILPIPDYILVPAYGYLCSLGVFNPLTTFLVCLVGAVFPLEYVCGRFAARPLLLKGLSFLRITENDIEVAESWLVDHGKFSIFISTFIPFFYTVAALAAGTLKMKSVPFLGASAAGFGLRYVFLEYIGFFSIFVFAASFDYAEREVFLLLLLLSCVYVGVHLIRVFWSEAKATGSIRAG